MKNLEEIHHFLAEHSWNSRYWIESDLASADDGGLELLLLKEVAFIRDSGHPTLSLELIALAQANGFASSWLLDNQARAHIRLSEYAVAYQIWRDLLVSDVENSLRQSCVRALLNFKAFDALAHADLVLQRSSTQEFDSGLAIATDLIRSKNWPALQAVLGSLTQQLWFHPIISYYRALACQGSGQVSDCLMICDVLLAREHPDAGFDQRVRELADSIRNDRSLHYDIDVYQAKLKGCFAEFGWHPVVVSGREQSLSILNKAVVKEAIFARDSGLTRMSLAILNLALLYEDNNPWALENKARALCLLGDYREAMDICRDILRIHPKHRAKDSALSMLENYDRDYKLASIYADVARLVELGVEQRQQALLTLRDSFAVGFGSEATKLMRVLMQAKSSECASSKCIELQDAWSSLKAHAEINRGLSTPAQSLKRLQEDVSS